MCCVVFIRESIGVNRVAGACEFPCAFSNSEVLSFSRATFFSIAGNNKYSQKHPYILSKKNFLFRPLTARSENFVVYKISIPRFFKRNI